VANKILVARGTKARLEEIKSTLATNELVYSTDTGELGVKKANGNIEYFMNAADIDVIVDTIETNKQDKLVAGENITIDENNVISVSGGGPIVDLGTFNDETELITHAIMNQLPTGHYTCIIRGAPGFILLERLSDRYVGTLQDSVSTFYYFVVSFYGEITAMIPLDLRVLTDVATVVDLADYALETYVDTELAKKVDKVTGKTLSTNDYTNTDKQSVEKIPTIEQDILDLESDKVDKVSGKGLSTNDFTTTEKNKLSGIQAGAQVNAVTTVAGRTGAVVLAKADVGLGSVQNYGISSQAQAIAGTVNTVYMTPLRTKEAITAAMGDIESALDAILGV